MSESIELIRKQMRERQIARIETCNPGRELDVLVAKYVMELQVETWSSEPGEPADYWYRSNSGLYPNDEEIERVPNYSTVFYAAEKILVKFKHWRIQSGMEQSRVAAAFSIGEEDPVEIGGCRTIAEAICKAALAAVVNNNKMIEQLLVE